MPAAVAIVLPIVIALLYIVAIEWIYFIKGEHSNLVAISTVMHFTMEFINLLLFTLFFTEMTKNVVGQMRPDFLDACRPVNGTCTREGADFKDGHKRFEEKGWSRDIPTYTPCSLITVVSYQVTLLSQWRFCSMLQSMCYGRFISVVLSAERLFKYVVST